MKKNIGAVCLALALLLLLSGCMAAAAAREGSIFGEIRLGGTRTTYKNLKADMSVEEVLKAEGLTQDDIETRETISAIDGCLVTVLRTKAETVYAETDGFGFQKLWYFRDGGLVQMIFEKDFDGAEFDEGIVKAREFMVSFVKTSGAKALGTDGSLQYYAYGTMPTRADEKDYYQVQFACGGILSTLNIYTQDMRDVDWYDGDFILTVNLCLNFENYGYDHKIR